MSDLSVNPAAALDRILRLFAFSGAGNVQDAWKVVLGADVGTVEFAQRHGEVVALVGSVGDRLRGLPEGNNLRNRSLRYLPEWYSAVVYVGPWDHSSHRAEAIITTSALDQLQGLGEQFDTIFGDERTSLSEDAIARLRENLQEWRDLMEDADLPRGVAEQIRAQVNHIEWLLENVNLFGTQPVVDKTRELVGSGVSAVAARPKLAVKIGAVMTGAVMFLGLAHKGVDEASGILEGVQKMTQHVQQIADGAGPKELTAVPTPPVDEVVDAEVVEEAAG